MSNNETEKTDQLSDEEYEDVVQYVKFLHKQKVKYISKRLRKEIKTAGKLIRRERKAKHLSYRWLAKELNVSRWEIRKLERPFYRFLYSSSEVIAGLFEILGIPLELEQSQTEND